MSLKFVFGLIGMKCFMLIFVVSVLGMFNDNLFKNVFVVLVIYYGLIVVGFFLDMVVLIVVIMFIVVLFFFLVIVGQIVDCYDWVMIM